jgi:adenylate cyclase
LAFIWLVSSFSGVWLGLGLNFAIFGSTAIYGLYMINKGILLDVSYTLVAEFVSGSVAYYLNFRKQHKLRQQIKKQFEHYLDPRQVAEKKYCTFLFTDVRGFTAMSERLDPQEVISIMNQALTIQTEAVQAHGGMVDKFIGDAMMAIFNAPLDLDKHEDKAIAAALQMRDEINKAQLDIRIGISVNSGEVVLGNTGSSSRFDYTAIGDAVNTAARLESATKDVGVDLLIGETTAQATKYKLQSLEPIQVKGKTNKLRIYTL